MARELTLESEEWYVLCNWLRERENRLMYALRDRSAEWEFVGDLRRRIEDRRGDAPETSGAVRTVTLSDSEFAYLSRYLRRRSLVLRFKPWRDRERRDVRRLRRQIRSRAESGAPTSAA
ncbi:hypothetical protein NGM10_12825 [Halorussus salilacus]|uniref:hypothetical protein n=1 Tax=Halorussus salilacus TaxID=2953750 RepID=UPI00209EDE91|nr:hypothetical protein [Halorussus salilacus]USZ67607.1 hypothetical protein NGM10_12825 [Halorussus salilacus]